MTLTSITTYDIRAEDNPGGDPVTVHRDDEGIWISQDQDSILINLEMAINLVVSLQSIVQEIANPNTVEMEPETGVDD